MVRVAVIGCGVLGIKIAGALAYSGHEVRVFDNNTSVLNNVYLRLNEDRKMLIEDGFLLTNNFVGELYCFSSFGEAIKGASFIIECVTEDLLIKKHIFKDIEAVCDQGSILISSSVRLKMDDIFQDLNSKERCLGVRFLYPVYFIPEVELLLGKDTSLDTLQKVRSFLERMGRVAFFRSGSEPIVLNEEHRESRKNAFIRYINEKKGIASRLSLPVPNLGAISLGEGEKSNILNSKIYQKEKECVVCMDSGRDCVLHPCHHQCTCINCGKLLLKRQDACPICRRMITNVFRVFNC